MRYYILFRNPNSEPISKSLVNSGVKLGLNDVDKIEPVAWPKS